jgi:CO/xanthine dehydrogenase FAD-binding subunit
MSAAFSAPSSLAEVLDALANGAVPLGGGTDLVVGHRQGKRLLPDVLVNLDRVAGLRGITQAKDGSLFLGALTNHQAIVTDALVLASYPALADASSIVGSTATRATGTIGGNVMNASPAADTIAPLLCHDAVAVLRSKTGERRVPFAELFVGPGRTIAAPGELLVGIELAPSSPTTGGAYVRLEYRRQMEIAIVGAAAVLRFDAHGKVEHAQVAMTALAPTIQRVPAAEHALIGSDAGDVAARAAGEAVAAASRPISDVRGSANYRRAMAAVITRRAIAAAAVRARGGTVRIPASDSTFAGQTGNEVGTA